MSHVMFFNFIYNFILTEKRSTETSTPIDLIPLLKDTGTGCLLPFIFSHIFVFRVIP